MMSRLIHCEQEIKTEQIYAKSNDKTINKITDDNLLDDIENNQKNKMLQNEIKEIDNKSLALVKLLVEAKKNKNVLDKSSNSGDDMTISFNPKSTNIYIDSDSENNVRVRNNNDKHKTCETNKINEQIEKIIDSNDGNEQSTNSNIIKKNTKNKSNINNSSNTSSLSIISNEVTERECYNDYMINLSEPIKLNDLNINNIQLPKRLNENISCSNNQLEIEIGINSQIIELEPDYYNRNEIIDFMNDCFDAYSLGIKLYIDNETDKFVFESNGGEKFKLISSPTSILPYLGFEKSTYFNKTKYIAESSLDVGDNIFYLVLENISEEPMFKIDMDPDEPIIEKLLELDGDIEIDHLIIKFYKTKKSLIKNDPEYSFFFESEHEIDFEFV